MGAKEACYFLNIGPQRLGVLVKKYDIPHYEIAAGKIFLQEDLEEFQENRKENMKYKYEK